jgi:hypothetical protein
VADSGAAVTESDETNNERDLNTTVQAVIYTLTVGVDPAGSGNVNLNPPGGGYEAGTTVNLTASPAEGYNFDHWSGDLSGGANPASINMDAGKSVTAHFTPIARPDLTVTALTTPAGLTAGSPVTVTATVANSGAADAGAFSVALYAGPDLVGSQTVASLTAGATGDVSFDWTPAVAGDVTLRAVADSGAAVTESDETNNELNQLVTVGNKIIILGDLNEDGEVTAADATLLLRGVVGLEVLTADQQTAAEVSGDGAVTAGDATLIHRFILELINIFPVETQV